MNISTLFDSLGQSVQMDFLLSSDNEDDTSLPHHVHLQHLDEIEEATNKFCANLTQQTQDFLLAHRREIEKIRSEIRQSTNAHIKQQQQRIKDKRRKIRESISETPPALNTPTVLKSPQSETREAKRRRILEEQQEERQHQKDSDDDDDDDDAVHMHDFGVQEEEEVPKTTKVAALSPARPNPKPGNITLPISVDNIGLPAASSLIASIAAAAHTPTPEPEVAVSDTSTRPLQTAKCSIRRGRGGSKAGRIPTSTRPPPSIPATAATTSSGFTPINNTTILTIPATVSKLPSRRSPSPTFQIPTSIASPPRHRKVQTAIRSKVRRAVPSTRPPPNHSPPPTSPPSDPRIFTKSTMLSIFSGTITSTIWYISPPSTSSKPNFFLLTDPELLPDPTALPHPLSPVTLYDFATYETIGRFRQEGKIDTSIGVTFPVFQLVAEDMYLYLGEYTWGGYGHVSAEEWGEMPVEFQDSWAKEVLSGGDRALVSRMLKEKGLRVTPGLSGRKPSIAKIKSWFTSAKLQLSRFVVTPVRWNLGFYNLLVENEPEERRLSEMIEGESRRNTPAATPPPLKPTSETSTANPSTLRPAPSKPIRTSNARRVVDESESESELEAITVTPAFKSPTQPPSKSLTTRNPPHPSRTTKRSLGGIETQSAKDGAIVFSTLPKIPTGIGSIGTVIGSNGVGVAGNAAEDQLLAELDVDMEEYIRKHDVSRNGRNGRRRRGMVTVEVSEESEGE